MYLLRKINKLYYKWCWYRKFIFNDNTKINFVLFTRLVESAEYNNDMDDNKNTHKNLYFYQYAN